MTQIPQAPIREYVDDIQDRVLCPRLHKSMERDARHLLERLVTEYVHGLIEVNGTVGCFSLPVAVHFGEDVLKWTFVCASDRQWERAQHRDRIDSGSLRPVVQKYSLLVKA